MTILSRMGAFMVGTALGAVQSLYFLHTDVKIVDSAMAKKIQSISQQVRHPHSASPPSLLHADLSLLGITFSRLRKMNNRRPCASLPCNKPLHHHNKLYIPFVLLPFIILHSIQLLCLLPYVKCIRLLIS